jgi:hypothetical protein
MDDALNREFKGVVDTSRTINRIVTGRANLSMDIGGMARRNIRPFGMVRLATMPSVSTAQTFEGALSRSSLLGSMLPPRLRGRDNCHRHGRLDAHLSGKGLPMKKSPVDRGGSRNVACI